jgi:hypothetical protein
MSTILHAAIDAVFGCRHSHVTRPFTLRRKTYEVCLDCGREIPYSLVTMSQIKGRGPSGSMSVAGTAKAGAL